MIDDVPGLGFFESASCGALVVVVDFRVWDVLSFFVWGVAAVLMAQGPCHPFSCLCFGLFSLLVRDTFVVVVAVVVVLALEPLSLH